ncbi:Non-symbiotic hemoglobin 1, partial [Caligus rogercresseyi]
YPAYQEKFFPDLHKDKKKLQRHGTIVMKSVGKLIGFVEANKIISLIETIKR